MTLIQDTWTTLSARARFRRSSGQSGPDRPGQLPVIYDSRGGGTIGVFQVESSENRASLCGSSGQAASGYNRHARPLPPRPTWQRYGR